ncbi:MAG: TlpA family protein disulfide reductase [Desulfocapsa sp.]|nr:TlpA family protein disulfide reductase [Desulfocapsa sp.]
MRTTSLFILVCCISFFIASCGEIPTVAEVGKPAPDFTLVDTKGKTWTLSQLKGQVVFVNFWATWCPPCREEMPSMQRVHTYLPKDTFKMLSILNNDNPALADDFCKKLGVTIPILNDPNGIIGKAYGLTGVPETFIIDKQGILREKFIGPAQWDAPGYIQMLMNYINK